MAVDGEMRLFRVLRCKEWIFLVAFRLVSSFIGITLGSGFRMVYFFFIRVLVGGVFSVILYL